jgi:hypothetical protein
MTSEFYFFDQYSHASRIGGVQRVKRDSKDFDQALDQLKIALSDKNDHSDHTGIDISVQIKKQTNDTSLQTITHELKKTIPPEILTKELDTILQTFDDKSKSTSPRSKSPEDDTDHKEEFIHETSNLPKISLPSSLILQLHSTWSDLIKNTNYKYKVKQYSLIE